MFPTLFYLSNDATAMEKTLYTIEGFLKDVAAFSIAIIALMTPVFGLSNFLYGYRVEQYYFSELFKKTGVQAEEGCCKSMVPLRCKELRKSSMELSS